MSPDYPEMVHGVPCGTNDDLGPAPEDSGPCTWPMQRPSVAKWSSSAKQAPGAPWKGQQMMSICKRAAAVAGCAVMLVGVGAGAVQAGEIQGNGTRNVPEHMHPGNSICAYSGQNDEFHEEEEGTYPRVQSWGQEVKVAGPMGGAPGTFCNPTRSPF